MKRILICGLPGTGKTTLATALVNVFSRNYQKVTWFNADKVRKEHNDWDFSSEGRLRQAKRMRDLADSYDDLDFVICDFVAPTEEIRSIFGADYTIWMDTEKTCDYEDTNKLFEQPKIANFIVTTKDAEFVSNLIVKDILLRL